jgi:hypothetical protein
MPTGTCPCRHRALEAQGTGNYSSEVQSRHRNDWAFRCTAMSGTRHGRIEVSHVSMPHWAPSSPKVLCMTCGIRWMGQPQHSPPDPSKDGRRIPGMRTDHRRMVV